MVFRSTLFGIDIERIIHSFKTALACLIGFVITKTFDYHFDQWLVITIIVVMCAQVNVGSILQKSYLRFLGTLLGTLVALLTVDLIGNNSIAISSVIAGAALFFSFLATGPNNMKEAGTLGAATVTIILLSPHPSVALALVRLVEITTGIVISALVSQFVLPIHARSHLQRSQKKNLQQLSEYYKTMLVLDTEPTSTKINELEYGIVQSLTLQRALAKDAGHEILDTQFNPKRFQNFLQCEVEILRSINFMHLTFSQSKSVTHFLQTLDALPKFNNAILAALAQISDAISQKKREQIIVIPSLQPLRQAIEQQHFSVEDRTNIDTFLFCGQVLIANLKKLAELHHVITEQR